MYAKSSAPDWRKWLRIYLGWILIVSATATSVAKSESASQVDKILLLINGMEQAWSEVTDYTKEVDKTERLVDGSLKQQTVLIKFRRPNQYYFRVLEGHGAGSELIYPKSPLEHVAIAHPGGFQGKLASVLKKTPLLNRMVPTEFGMQDPQIIKGQHQTILDSSLGQTIHQIAQNLRTAAQRGEGTMQLAKERSENGEWLFRVDVDLPAESGHLHEVKEQESLWTIASQYDCPMYVIWYNNSHMKGPSDLSPGQTVFVPRYYAAKGHIWISSTSMLLKKLEIFDSAGQLYERYDYLRIDTNVGLTDLDFDTENPEYNF